MHWFSLHMKGQRVSYHLRMRTCFEMATMTSTQSHETAGDAIVEFYPANQIVNLTQIWIMMMNQAQTSAECTGNSGELPQDWDLETSINLNWTQSAKKDCFFPTDLSCESLSTTLIRDSNTEIGEERDSDFECVGCFPLGRHQT